MCPGGAGGRQDCIIRRESWWVKRDARAGERAPAGRRLWRRLCGPQLFCDGYQRLRGFCTGKQMVKGITDWVALLPPVDQAEHVSEPCSLGSVLRGGSDPRALLPLPPLGPNTLVTRYIVSPGLPAVCANTQPKSLASRPFPFWFQSFPHNCTFISQPENVSSNLTTSSNLTQSLQRAPSFSCPGTLVSPWQRLRPPAQSAHVLRGT